MKQTKPDTRRKEEESMQKRELSEERFLIPATNAPEEAGGFSAEELGADVDGMSLGFQRIKYPPAASSSLKFHPVIRNTLTMNSR